MGLKENDMADFNKLYGFNEIMNYRNELENSLKKLSHIYSKISDKSVTSKNLRLVLHYSEPPVNNSTRETEFPKETLYRKNMDNEIPKEENDLLNGFSLELITLIRDNINKKISDIDKYLSKWEYNG